MWLAICVIGAIVAAVVYILWKISFFEPINQKESTIPKLRILFFENVGPYSKAYKRTATIEEAVKEKFGVDLSDSPCFGIYYDNPKTTPKEKARSIIGKIIDPADNTDFTGAAEGLHIKDIPGGEKALVLDTAFHNSTGVFVAITRIYGAIQKYFAERKGKMTNTIEIYSKDKITVYCPLVKPHGSVWVPFDH